MSGKKRFVSWAAVSSLPQAKKISLDDQLKTNREHIERHNGVLVAKLVVPGESRSIVLFEDAARKMEAYARLKQMIDARAFDVLVYLDRSRLGRKASLSMAVVELCQEAGIMLYETDNPPATLEAPRAGYDEQLIGAIKSVGAAHEVVRLKRRHAMGIAHRVEQGRMPGDAPYGYMLRYDERGESHVEVKEHDAVVVRLIFELYLDGAGSRQIGNVLNERGYPAPLGGEWSYISVINILNRAWRYAGYSEVNKRSKTGREYIRAKGNWQPLISEETAQAAEKEREARRANRKLPTTPYLLTGVVWCLDCGYSRSVSSHTDLRKKKPKRRVWFRCKKHTGGIVMYDVVLSAVYAAVEHVIATPVDDLLSDDGDPTEPVLAQIAAEESATERIAAALHRVDDAFAAGVLDMERYTRQVNLLTAQYEDARRRIAELRLQLEHVKQQGKRHERIEDIKKRGLAILNSDDTAKANAWLRKHLRVWCEAGEIHHIELL